MKEIGVNTFERNPLKGVSTILMVLGHDSLILGHDMDNNDERKDQFNSISKRG
jgi:hypothetical protein